MTLTFYLATWFLFAPYYFVMITICARLFLNTTMHNNVMGWTRTGVTDVYARLCIMIRTVTLTFDLAIWFLLEKHCLVKIIICAKLFFQDDYLCQIIFKIPLCTAKLWRDTILEHTKTHTDRVNSRSNISSKTSRGN